VKHESQRRVRSAKAPVRSVVSSTVVQKQVGHASVQLPQARQRPRRPPSARCRASAAAPRRGRGCRACGPCGRRLAQPAVGLGDLVVARGPAAELGEHLGRRARCRPRAGRRAPRPPATSSVSARSKPPSALGPVPIEAQKQVPPGSVQCTATTKAARGAPGSRVDVGAAGEHAVLDGDRRDVAGPHADEGVARRRCGSSSTRSRPRRRARRATAAARADAGSASRRGARRCSRSGRRRRARDPVVRRPAPPPASCTSVHEPDPAACRRRRRRARRRRWRRRGAWAPRACSRARFGVARAPRRAPRARPRSSPAYGHVAVLPTRR
jgi:hypothetical protein